ncbi:hypothetical protein KAR91_55990 [Candidatus Pacearchaeota archaeon]|nr:hypothetical protein [Candidatus Pacearchaeota archaeon]
MVKDLDNSLEDPSGVIAGSTKLNKISISIPCCADGEVLDISLTTPKQKLALDVFNVMTSHLGIRTDVTVKKGGGGT